MSQQFFTLESLLTACSTLNVDFPRDAGEISLPFPCHTECIQVDSPGSRVQLTIFLVRRAPHCGSIA